MSYLSAIQGAASPMGTPPPGRAVGTPPALSGPTHTEPPPYDVTHDPGWAGIIDPNNKPLVQFLNELSPEHRQMLLHEVMKLKAGAMLNQPPKMPPQPSPGPPGAGAPVLPPQ